MTPATTTLPTLTADDLTTAGLTGEQIARLVTTRAHYSPFREFFDDRELQRLGFLRWRIEHGRIASEMDA